MPSTVRISDEAHRILKTIADDEGVSLTAALDKLTEEWERVRFFERLNEAYLAVQQRRQEWEEEQLERALWDKALLDDLADEDERTTEQG